MTQLGHTCTTIKVYLAAICNLHITTGTYNIFRDQLTPIVYQVVRGILKAQSMTKPVRVHLPITIDIMHKIKTVLIHQPHRYHNILMWAVSCTSFGWLRCSEFTMPAQAEYDAAVHLSYDDVAVDKKLILTIQIKYVIQNRSIPQRCNTHTRQDWCRHLSNQCQRALPSNHRVKEGTTVHHRRWQILDTTGIYTCFNNHIGGCWVVYTDQYKSRGSHHSQGSRDL